MPVVPLGDLIKQAGVYTVSFLHWSSEEPLSVSSTVVLTRVWLIVAGLYMWVC